MRTAGICLQSSPRTKLGLERTGVNDSITIEFYALGLHIALNKKKAVRSEKKSTVSRLYYDTSKAFNKILTSASVMPPPSGSTASIHRLIAMTCFGFGAFIQTRPFMPTAASNGNTEPSNGSRKWSGDNSL